MAEEIGGIDPGEAGEAGISGSLLVSLISKLLGGKIDAGKIAEIVKLLQKVKKATEGSEKEAKKNNSLLKGLTGLANTLISSVNKSITVYTKYSIAVQAALEGSKQAAQRAAQGISSYQRTVDNLNAAIGKSGLANMDDVLKNMEELTTKGIVSNVEQRAFLASIKDGVVNAFDVADSTMMRLIKLQAEDSTTNRLVMQASLRDFLNQNYENSQYIYKEYQQVSDNLLEATSLLTSSLSLSLESTVQKWLGSLSSVGLSEDAVTSLAKAIGYVGSGNIADMESSGLQNLVIMGANRAGLSYSDLLTGGLDAAATNQLMAGMIQYLGSLSGNNVVLSEYAKTFGIKVSDIVAARNAQSDLEKLIGTTIDSSSTGLSRYLQNYDQYLNYSPALMYDNLINNVLFGTGLKVAGDPEAYKVYKIGDLIGKTANSLGLTGIVGNIVNAIGPVMQLGAAMGITSIDTSGGLGSIFSGGVDQVMSLFNNVKDLAKDIWAGGVDTLTAYNTLRQLTGNFDVLAATAPKQGASRSSSGASRDFERGNTVEASLDEAFAAMEEAQSARTADDIFEFLSNDVVSITPFVNEGDATSQLINYNKITAEASTNILKFLEKTLEDILTGNIALINVSVPSSMLQTTGGELSNPVLNGTGL